MPACATACPTESIQFGPLDELRERADARLAELQEHGETGSALRARPGRRGRWRRRVLPAAGRARGVRAAPGPDGDHPGSVARCGGTPRRPRSPWPSRWLPGSCGRPDDHRAAAPAGATARARRGVDGAARRVPLLLRPAHPQAADLEGARRPGLPVPGRRRRGVGVAGRAGRRHRPARAAPGRAAGVGGRCGGVSVVALVHDLGRPERFLNMLRVFKPTSPLSVGSWLLAPFGTLAGAAAATELTGIAPALAGPAGAGAGLLGSGAGHLHSVLLADTAVPAWHEAYRELPFVFAGSALASGGGLGLLAGRDTGPAARVAVAGAALELTASAVLERRIGFAARAYTSGRAGVVLRAARATTAAGASPCWPANGSAAGAGDACRPPAGCCSTRPPRPPATGSSTPAGSPPPTPRTPWSRSAPGSPRAPAPPPRSPIGASYCGQWGVRHGGPCPIATPLSRTSPRRSRSDLDRLVDEGEQRLGRPGPACWPPASWAGWTSEPGTGRAVGGAPDRQRVARRARLLDRFHRPHAGPQ